jgi:hypothetical protein
MDHDYEDLGVEFTLFPGVDLRLWLTIIMLLLTMAGAIVGAALALR